MGMKKEQIFFDVHELSDITFFPCHKLTTNPFLHKKVKGRELGKGDLFLHTKVNKSGAYVLGLYEIICNYRVSKLEPCNYFFQHLCLNITSLHSVLVYPTVFQDS